MERLCGVRPGRPDSLARSRYQPHEPVPVIFSVRLLGVGPEARCEIELEGYGTVIMPARDALRWRRFHTRAMEQLLVVFDWPMEAGRWRYLFFKAIWATARQDAEAGR